MCYTVFMQTCYIGDIIRENRVRLNISQEELSFDLCSVPTLSRIESGKQIPGRKLVEALFSKMGMAVPAASVPMTRLDLLRGRLEYQINDIVAAGSYEIDELLEQYRTCGGDLNDFEQQYYLFFKAIYESEHGGEPEAVLKQLEKVLPLSETAINICIQYGKLTQFPYHLFNKGYALALLGKKMEAKVFIQQAFNVFEAVKKPDKVAFASKIVNEKFGFDFPIT